MVGGAILVEEQILLRHKAMSKQCIDGKTSGRQRHLQFRRGKGNGPQFIMPEAVTNASHGQ